MRARIEQELLVLRERYPDIEHREHEGEDWFYLPRFPFPPGWRLGEHTINEGPLAFKIGAAYPAAEPYGFAAPASLNFGGMQPNNVGAASYPFDGEWRQFSWAPDGWAPGGEVLNGCNLFAWVRSFSSRLKEGA